MKLFGETIHVGAEIYNLEGFSGHADQKGLLDWLGGFQVKPKQIFLVHGELDSKKDFAEIVKNQFGFDPVVITENSEFELETGKLLSRDEVIREAIDEDDVAEMQERMSEVELNIKSVLENAKNVMASEISADKLQQINNILLELEKASLNLGSSITAEDRSSRPLSEEK